jgi:hypothetical protein
LTKEVVKKSQKTTVSSKLTAAKNWIAEKLDSVFGNYSYAPAYFG